MLLTGLVLSSFCQDYATQISYCLVFGLTEGAYVGLTAVITIDIIGMDMWVQAYGVQLFFMGIACIIGPPLTGEFHLPLRKQTGMLSTLIIQ